MYNFVFLSDSKSKIQSVLVLLTHVVQQIIFMMHIIFGLPVVSACSLSSLFFCCFFMKDCEIKQKALLYICSLGLLGASILFPSNSWDIFGEYSIFICAFSLFLCLTNQYVKMCSPSLIPFFSPQSQSSFIGLILMSFALFFTQAPNSKHPFFFYLSCFGLFLFSILKSCYQSGKAISIAHSSCASPRIFFFYHLSPLVSWVFALSCFFLFSPLLFPAPEKNDEINSTSTVAPPQPIDHSPDWQKRAEITRSFRFIHDTQLELHQQTGAQPLHGWGIVDAEMKNRDLFPPLLKYFPSSPNPVQSAELPASWSDFTPYVPQRVNEDQGDMSRLSGEGRELFAEDLLVGRRRLTQEGWWDLMLKRIKFGFQMSDEIWFFKLMISICLMTIFEAIIVFKCLSITENVNAAVSDSSFLKAIKKSEDAFRIARKFVNEIERKEVEISQFVKNRLYGSPWEAYAEYLQKIEFRASSAETSNSANSFKSKISFFRKRTSRSLSRTSLDDPSEELSDLLGHSVASRKEKKKGSKFPLLSSERPRKRSEVQLLSDTDENLESLLDSELEGGQRHQEYSTMEEARETLLSPQEERGKRELHSPSQRSKDLEEKKVERIIQQSSSAEILKFLVAIHPFINANRDSYRREILTSNQNEIQTCLLFLLRLQRKFQEDLFVPDSNNPSLSLFPPRAARVSAQSSAVLRRSDENLKKWQESKQTFSKCTSEAQFALDCVRAEMKLTYKQVKFLKGLCTRLKKETGRSASDSIASSSIFTRQHVISEIRKVVASDADDDALAEFDDEPAFMDPSNESENDSEKTRRGNEVQGSSTSRQNERPLLDGLYVRTERSSSSLKAPCSRSQALENARQQGADLDDLLVLRFVLPESLWRGSALSLGDILSILALRAVEGNDISCSSVLVNQGEGSSLQIWKHKIELLAGLFGFLGERAASKTSTRLIDFVRTFDLSL
eukprot:GDKJ01020205.1.p1 GENE.GDKJ01020205.1~~GDKJ01020205.1.p1  ORF type:complete len:1029 (+),score=213.49 GDKJ01020205.1:221-3088(+)